MRMKNGIVIADAGPIFSLATINRLDLLDLLFHDVKIPRAVWEEITLNESTAIYSKIKNYFKNKVCAIKGFNELNFVMDYGESESVILYNEIQADFLLIDDKKARNIAENIGIKCIGTIGVLVAGKNNGFIKDLRPLFKLFLEKKRFYSLHLLNHVLAQQNEKPLISRENR
jgi:predicted nucleic acid-binding protein